jgi:hypothetical protein
MPTEEELKAIRERHLKACRDRYAAKRDEILAQQRLRYRTDKEYREKICAYQRAKHHNARLYAALKEASYEFCNLYCYAFRDDEGSMPSSDEMVEIGCPKKSKTCFVRRWWKTLKSARAEK